MLGWIKKWWLNRKRRAFERRMMAIGASSMLMASSVDASKFGHGDVVAVDVRDGLGAVLGSVSGVHGDKVWIKVNDHAE